MDRHNQELKRCLHKHKSLLMETHPQWQYWLKIRNFKECGMCHSCHTIESMQHIIFNCEANNCSYAWDVVRELCELKHIPWPRDFDITSIVALPLLKMRSANNKIRTGATRLFLIAASECAFLL